MKNKDIASAVIGSAFFAIPYLGLSIALAPSLVIGCAAFGATKLVLSEVNTKESLKETDLVLTQINLNDGTPEGISHKELPLKCIQYHPEAGPGPNDTRSIFDEFSQMMDDY